MSWKIYNGYRIRARTLDEAFALLNTHENREAISKIRREMVAKWMARNIAQRIDLAHLYPEDEKLVEEAKCPAISAYREFRNQETRAVVDFNFEVSLIPVPNSRPRMVLGMLFTQQTQFRDWFNNLDIVEEYYWWDNTDRPDSITHRQWERREKIWKKVFGRCTCPAEVGVSLTMNRVEDEFIIETELLKPHYEPVSERAKILATNHVRNMVQRRESGTIKEVWELVWATEQIMKSHEINAQIDKLSREYEKTLPDLQTYDF